MTEEINKDSMFLIHLEKKIFKARKKFPNQDMDTTFKALIEEIGELAKALLEDRNIYTSTIYDHALYEEAVQVACMAMRIATEHIL